MAQRGRARGLLLPARQQASKSVFLLYFFGSVVLPPCSCCFQGPIGGLVGGDCSLSCRPTAVQRSHALTLRPPPTPSRHPIAPLQVRQAKSRLRADPGAARWARQAAAPLQSRRHAAVLHGCCAGEEQLWCIAGKNSHALWTDYAWRQPLLAWLFQALTPPCPACPTALPTGRAS